MNEFVLSTVNSWLDSPTSSHERRDTIKKFRLEIYSCTVLFKELHFVLFNIPRDQSILNEVLQSFDMYKDMFLEKSKTKVPSITLIRFLNGLGEPAEFPLIPDWIVTETHNATTGIMLCDLKILVCKNDPFVPVKIKQIFIQIESDWLLEQLHASILNSDFFQTELKDYEIVEFLDGHGVQSFGVDGKKLSEFRHTGGIGLSFSIQARAVHSTFLEVLL